MDDFASALFAPTYYGADAGSIADVGAASNPTFTPATAEGQGGGYFAGLLQATTALGTGYLAKRLDIDLYSRAVGAQPAPTLGTTQNGVLIRQAGVPQPGGVSQVAARQGGATLLNLNALMPYLLVGAAVFFIAKKAG